MGREQMQNSRSSIGMYPSHNSALLHSKSSGNMQQLQMAAARHAVQMAANMNAGGPRAIMVSHPLQLGPIGVMQTPQMSLVNSPSSGNILHVSDDHVPCVTISSKIIIFDRTSLLRG